MRAWLLAGLLAFAGPAAATTIVGADYGGLPLSPANGDVLSGTFTNVSSFTLAVGATVYVSPSDTLAVYASTIAIYGTLDGSGRGAPGGAGGASGVTGTAGFAAAAGGSGSGGAAGKGGGGAAAFADGGAGAGPGGAKGAGYGTSVSAPLSVDDAWQGSGGGGGGGSNGLAGGGGAGGGAAIYLEASSVTVRGAINAAGGVAPSVTDGAAGVHPGGGGGGGGGTIVLRVTGALTVGDGAKLAADGGKGGNVDTVIGGTLEPGGGGGGGRIRVFAPAATYGAITISTAAGAAGSKTSGFGGNVDATNPPAAGTVGEVRFGTVAVSPSNFAAQAVYVTSISYVWTATPQFGDGANPQYRLFPFTSTAPLASPDATSAVNASTVTSLSPNTTYYRFVTAYTDWGDSDRSNAVSTHTLANLPGAAAAPFSSMADTGLTFSWTANAPANPSYTTYEINRALDANFGVSVATSFVAALSSAPTGLLPNTSYYLRVRAINLDNVPSAYAATLTTATLASPPAAPAFGTVFVTSASFVWARGANPADTLYEAQVSTDNFFSLAATSDTLAGSATFFSLTPGTQYYFRAFALNRNGAASAFSTVVSTRSGNLSDTSQPTTPGTPQSDRRFSYDGTVLFAWSAAQHAVGILNYRFIVGSTPGGSDVAAMDVTATSATIGGLQTGRTYYARVRAQSNAGVNSDFSDVSAGVPVLVTAQASPFAKPYNWPNPFDPAQGPTQIGISLDAAAEVKLRVFTLNGRPVHERAFSFPAGGNQILDWDGRNDSGARVAPGGYVVLIEKRYGSKTDTQRLKVAVVY